MADLSTLGGLNPIEQLDLDGTYPVAKESTFQLPPKGDYVLRNPDTFPVECFSPTKAGDISVQIDPTIASDPHEGFTVRFTKVSSKVFARGSSKVSQLGDFLKANGWSGRLSNAQDIANAMDAVAGRTYRAKLDWRGYNKRTGWSIEGMEKFPRNSDGTYQSWTIDPTEVGKTDDQGRQLRVLANLTIPFGGFYPADAV